MKTMQRGFTLIELVVVIVILGILAATALPKFVDLSSEAGTAATKGVSGAIASATALNYAAKVANKGGVASLNDATNAATCAKLDSTANPRLVNGVTLTYVAAIAASGDGDNYNVSEGAGNCAAAGAGGSITCTVQGYKGVSAPTTVICTD